MLVAWLSVISDGCDSEVSWSNCGRGDPPAVDPSSGGLCHTLVLFRCGRFRLIFVWSMVCLFAMRGVEFDDLDGAIELCYDAERKPVRFGRSVDCLGSDQLLGEFLSIYAQLVVRYGAPDFPCISGHLCWIEVLGLEDSRLVAVWDFDYYQLSLHDVDGYVVLQRYETGVVVLPD